MKQAQCLQSKQSTVSSFRFAQNLTHLNVFHIPHNWTERDDWCGWRIYPILFLFKCCMATPWIPNILIVDSFLLFTISWYCGCSIFRIYCNPHNNSFLYHLCFIKTLLSWCWYIVKQCSIYIGQLDIVMECNEVRGFNGNISRDLFYCCQIKEWWINRQEIRIDGHPSSSINTETKKL